MNKITCSLILACILGASGNAATVTYKTPSGFTYSSLPDDFVVSVTTAANSITLQFTDNTVNPTSDTQTITGLALVLNGSFAGTPTISNATGQLINIDKNGNPSNDTVDSINGWTTSNAGVASNLTTLYLSIFTGGSPDDAIIGNPNTASALYDAANGSIAGSKHNPFIKQTATFTLTLSGVTASTTVSKATFNFGTMQGLCIGGTSDQCVDGIKAVPEPGTFAMPIAAGLLFGIRRVRRWRQRSAA